jgi:type IX secretion system PorP/SprF family membrane protein
VKTIREVKKQIYMKISFFKIIVLCVLLQNTLFAQQDAMFTHYMYNTLAVNPAYAGSRDALTLTALNRSQWVGIAGAPMTQTITAHTPFKKDNIGIGASIMNDKLGPINNTALYFDFAYRLKLDKKSTLSMGLKAGLNFLNAKLNQLNLDEQNDQSFQNAGASVAPNFGFGLYYSRDRFYAGLSTPRLLQNNLKPGAQPTIALREKRHYFMIAGYQFKINEDIEMKPTTFIKVTAGAPVEMDLTASIIWKKFLHLGAMFRTGDAFGILAGYNITEQLLLSYAFDWSYALQTVRYNGGSHEIMLRYDFIIIAPQKIRSPRYF